VALKPPPETRTGRNSMWGVVLWLMGVPLTVIILLALIT
jgi:hypothetical protein